MGDNIFRVLFTAAKAKITPIVTKIKMWTSWNFIRTRVIASIRDFFSSLLNIKPRDRNDYYEIFGWMVSRRLAFAVVVVVGLFSVFYLVSLRSSVVSDEAEGLKTYSYRSVMLRFAKDKVRITGKGGYLAYEGEVKNGSVTGFGTLYNRDGVVVYRGNFDKNRYQGSGTRYYDSGTLYYSGNFQENQFDGSGKLYRENGSMEYEGEFSHGKKDGQGKLYDNGSNLIYTGGFSQDAILYSDLLGKKVSEISKVYSGQRILYEDEENFTVVLKDIEAMYIGSDNSQSLDDEMSVDAVLVLKDVFEAGGKSLTSIEELRNYFGEAAYEGNSGITMPEAVAMNWMNQKNHVSYEKVEITAGTGSGYDDYIMVEDYDRSYIVYMYSFQKDGLVYTFICDDREGGFAFYSIEKDEDGEIISDQEEAAA